MTTVQTSSSFAAEAVRFGSDKIGNGAYFLPDSSGPAEDLTVPGTLTVGGTTTLEGNTSVGSPSQNANFLVSGTASADNFQGTNPADGLRAAFQQGLISNGVTIAGTNGSTLLLGDSTTPGGNIIGYNGSAAIARVNFGNGFNSRANCDVSGTLAASVSLTSGDALICGSTASPGGQIYGFSGVGVMPPMFPYGLFGGANSYRYYISQPTNGVDVQGPTLTFDGTPINLQLNSSVGANARTFVNIILTDASSSLRQSGKVIIFGLLYIGGGAGAGVVINFYRNLQSPQSLLRQFGMNPAGAGGALRGFQAIFENGNPYTNPSNIHAFSWAAIDSQ